jgi:hypothetical protein
MTRLPDNHPLRAELDKARGKVVGKTFAEAPELFKDVEAAKVRIGHAEGKYKWLARA